MYKDRKLILDAEGHAYTFDNKLQHVRVKEFPSLYSNQEETVTRVVLYCTYAHDQGY